MFPDFHAMPALRDAASDQVPVRLTSLYIRIPKTPGTEPGKNDLHYCQRTTASGDCRLRPAGAERSWFGNGISGWSVRLYVSERKTPVRFTTASLGKLAVVKASLADFQCEPRRASADSRVSTASCRWLRAPT